MLADEAAEHAGEGPGAARMTEADATVTAHHHPRLRIEGTHVLFDHRVADDAGVLVLDEPDVEVHLADAFGPRDLVEPFAFVVAPCRQTRDLNIPSSPHVVQGFFHAGRVVPAFVRHEHLQVRVPGQVRVAVGGHIHAAFARRLDHGDHFERLLPDTHRDEIVIYY